MESAGSPRIDSSEPSMRIDEAEGSRCPSDVLPESCDWCPRHCGANRRADQAGFCGADSKLRIARAALHHWEEPPISGDAGSGAVFFSHCSLRCVYCQNRSIARGATGATISLERLGKILLELEQEGAMNVNLVTPGHYRDHVLHALSIARADGLSLPIVWNTSGYETAASIELLEESIDVYLTDFKYGRSETARRYSNAPDYAEIALRALDQMVEQNGQCRYDEFHGVQRLTKGVIVRHLLLPGHLRESCEVVALLHRRYGSAIRFSLMSQYTPVIMHDQELARRFPELCAHVPDREYELLLDFADEIGVSDYFWQEGPADKESFIPAFDLTGVR